MWATIFRPGSTTQKHPNYHCLWAEFPQIPLLWYIKFQGCLPSANCGRPTPSPNPSHRAHRRVCFQRLKEESFKLKKRKTSVTQDCEIILNCDTASPSLKYYPCVWTHYPHIHTAVYCQSATAHANLAGNGWHCNKENENGSLRGFTMMQRNSSINYSKSANSQSKSKSLEELKSVKYGSLLNQRDTSPQRDLKVWI